MGDKLTKAELSRHVAEVCDWSLKDSRELLDIVLDSMSGALQRGERIEIRGFGCFGTRVRGTRVARNPITGGKQEIPPKRVPYFRVAKELDQMLNPKGVGAPGAR